MTPPPAAELLSADDRASVQSSLRVGLLLVEDELRDLTRDRIPFLQESAQRLIQAGGKRYRPTLVLLAFLANGGRPFTKEVIRTATMMELLHTASLVHDDILDDADLRRGILATHRQYGTPRAILAGDYLFSLASSLMLDLPRDIQQALLHAARLVVAGEAQELELTRAGAATLEEYFEVIAKKTASLLEACAYCGARLAQAQPTPQLEAFAEYGFNAGITFQLIDDLLDVEGVTEITGKPAQLDLTRGVPNAAVLATLEADVRGRPHSLQLPRAGQAQLDEVLARMSEIRGDERVRRLAAMYARRAVDALQGVPASDARDLLTRDIEIALSRRR